MKILHISSAAYGGAYRAAFRIHESLLKNGVDSQFITLDQPDVLTPVVRKKNYFVQKIQWRLRHHFNIECDLRRRIYKQLSDLPVLNCEVASIPVADSQFYNHPLVKNADIIHLHWVSRGFDYIDFFGNIGKPVVWTIHDMNPFMGLFHYEADLARNKSVAGDFDKMILKLKKRILKKFGYPLIAVAPSSWMQQKIRAGRVFKNRKVDLIPNPIDSTRFSPQIKKAVREKLGMLPDAKVLIAVADYTSNYRKGFDLLTKALKTLPDVKVLLIGGTENSSGETENIRYLGRIENDDLLAEYYSAADATVIPSREDNLPNVMLESLACGTPVISFKVGGMPDHIHNFKTGLLAEEMTSESLAATIRLFFENQKTFEREVIRQYAKEHFDETLIAEKYKQVYKRCLAKSL